MTHLLPPQTAQRLPGGGFWRKTWAMLVKEFIQLKRDRVSFAMNHNDSARAVAAIWLRHQQQPSQSAHGCVDAGKHRSVAFNPGHARKHKIFSRQRSRGRRLAGLGHGAVCDRADLRYDAIAMFVLMLIAMTIAVTRFRRTLD